VTFRKTGQLSVAVIVANVLLFFSGTSSLHAECISSPPLKPIQCVRGKVIDHTGGEISNAKVTILQGETEVVSVRTNADGAFSFERLTPGNYEIRVETKGPLRTLSEAITVVRPEKKCKRALEVVLGVGFECDTYIALVKAKDIR
jgi:hypothetical protein